MPEADVTYAAGTTVSSNYLPWARVLAESFLAHNPGSSFHVMVTDELGADALRHGDGFMLVSSDELGYSRAQYDWLRTIYPPFLLSCALKPALLRYLMREHDAGFYLDSDTAVYGSLADIADLAAKYGVALTPHSLEPMPLDGLHPTDDTFLEYGLFNAGFVATGSSGAAFLDFWESKLLRDCTIHSEKDPHRAGDQRWLDLAIPYFNPHVLRDPGLNVGYWNLGPRVVQRAGHEPLVDGVPLKHLHFSGFDPAAPDRLSAHARWPAREEVTSEPVVSLCRDYAARLLEAGWSGAKSAPLVTDGVVLTHPTQEAVLAALVECERLGVAPEAGPLEPGILVDWLRAPAASGPLSWFLWGLREAHPAIARAFPDVPGGGENAYIAWSSDEGMRSGIVPPPLAGPATPLDVPPRASFSFLIEADEIRYSPALLSGLADAFATAADARAYVRAAGAIPEELVTWLTPILDELGLSAPESLELVALTEAAGPAAIAPLVDAILTAQQPDPAFADLPRAATAAELRAIAGARASQS